jgi:hypothetical protein
MSNKTPERFYMDTDGDGHWFIVPVKRRADFDDWLAQDWSSELAVFITPSYATEADNPQYITFEAPEDES